MLFDDAYIVFLGIKHSGRAMLKNPGGPSGSIVVISSQLGLEGAYLDSSYSYTHLYPGAAGLSAYSASKVSTELGVTRS